MDDDMHIDGQALFGASPVQMGRVRRGIFPLSAQDHVAGAVIYPFFAGWELLSLPADTYDFDNRTRTDNDGQPFAFVQFTMQGSAFFDDGRSTMPVPAGHAVVVPVPSPTRLYADARCASYEFIWVNMLGAAAHRWASDLVARHGSIIRLTQRAPALASMTRLFTMACTGAWRTSPDLALLENFRLTLSLSRELGRGERRDPLLERMQALIAEHCGDPDFSVVTLARLLGISRGHLARIVRAGTGRTVIQAIKERRLQQAAILLAQGVSARKASRACGYRDTAYFNRDYRRHTGMGGSPPTR
jgi:AraC-like DNA-binding protein